jgi:hypothetical protein
MTDPAYCVAMIISKVLPEKLLGVEDVEGNVVSKQEI